MYSADSTIATPSNLGGQRERADQDHAEHRAGDGSDAASQQIDCARCGVGSSVIGLQRCGRSATARHGVRARRDQFVGG